MKGLVAVAVLAVVPFAIACADADVAPASASPSAGPSALMSAPPTPTRSGEAHEPIGLLPDDCEPGPQPVLVSDHVAAGIGGDPVWAIGFGGAAATLSFSPDDPYRDHGWLRKVLWLLDRSASDPVTVTGVRVADGLQLWFQYRQGGSQEPVLLLDPAAPDGEHGDWYEYRGYFVAPTAGCYRLRAAWPGGGWELPFRAGLDETLH